MYMESPIFNEENYFNFKSSNDIIKKSIHYLDSKSSFITNELERIKDYFKFLMNKAIITENSSTELNLFLNSELDKQFNLSNYFKKNTKSTTHMNQLFKGQISTKTQQAFNDLPSEERLFANKQNLQINNTNTKTINISNVNKSPSFNKLITSNLNTESSKYLPKIVSNSNLSTLQGKTNFEKFISTPNNKQIGTKVFNLKTISNEESDGIKSSNKDLLNLNITNNSNFPSYSTHSPVINSKNSYSIPSFNVKKGEFSFKNNILKENQKPSIEEKCESREKKENEDSKEKVSFTTITTTSIKHGIGNTKILQSSKFKIDSNVIQSKITRTNLNKNGKKSSDTKINFENLKNVNNHKEILLKEKINAIANDKNKNKSHSNKKENEGNIKLFTGIINTKYKIKNQLDILNFQNPVTKNLSKQATIFSVNNLQKGADKSEFPNFTSSEMYKVHSDQDILNNSNLNSSNKTRASGFQVFSQGRLRKQSSVEKNSEFSSEKESFNAENFIKNQSNKTLEFDNNINLKKTIGCDIPQKKTEFNKNKPIMKHITPNNVNDTRKFSILDIQGAENFHDLRQLIEKNNKEIQKGNLNNRSKCDNISENNDESICNDEDDQSYSNKSDYFNEKQEKNYILNKLPNKQLKSLFLTIISDITPIKVKLKIIQSFATISKLYPMRKIIISYKNLLEIKIDKIKNFLIEKTKDLEYPKFSDLDQNFKPSATALNGLNFISNAEAEKIQNFKVNNEHIADFVKIIYLLLRENYNNIPQEDLTVNLFKKILPKYKIDNIKSLYLNLICPNLLFTEEQIKAITHIVDNNKSLFDFNTINKVSKGFSFLIFIMKEIINHISQVTPDGISVLNLRKLKKKLEKYKLTRLKCEEILENIIKKKN